MLVDGFFFFCCCCFASAVFANPICWLEAEKRDSELLFEKVFMFKVGHIRYIPNKMNLVRGDFQH